MDTNSSEAAMWSENMKLKSENEHLRSVLGVALAEHDNNEGEYGPTHMPHHWTHLARRALSEG